MRLRSLTRCLSLSVLVVLAAACSGGTVGAGTGDSPDPASGEAVATFAGGCFWCMESALERVDGVNRVISGYTGGGDGKPAYEQVSSGRTGHVEAIRIVYDPEKVEYDRLLEVFWMEIDPTDDGGQFADRGDHYRTAIFVHGERQREAAERSKLAMGESGRFDGEIVTRIEEAGPFFPAEDYHQDYYRKNPKRYKAYRAGSGREAYLAKVWAEDEREGYVKPNDEDLRDKLSPLQFEVTQQCGTEPPFRNEYWDNKREGIYVDVVSGEPLFSSTDKYDSGSGWPSFTRPLESESIVETSDRSHGMVRTEIRSKNADSHLGHVFPDGPGPTGTRYCINSASLRFVPKEDMEKEGYGEYLGLFETDSK